MNEDPDSVFLPLSKPDPYSSVQFGGTDSAAPGLTVHKKNSFMPFCFMSVAQPTGIYLTVVFI